MPSRVFRENSEPLYRKKRECRSQDYSFTPIAHKVATPQVYYRSEIKRKELWSRIRGSISGGTTFLF